MGEGVIIPRGARPAMQSREKYFLYELCGV